MERFENCDFAATFILSKVKAEDTLEPVFASSFNLDLEYKKNLKLDTLLYEKWAEANAKAWGIAQVYEFSFARLKNVPEMYFFYGTGEAHTLGLAIIVDGRLLFLWKDWCHRKNLISIQTRELLGN